MVDKYDVYQVHKFGRPSKVVGGLSRLQARKTVKELKDGKTFFYGFVKQGTKVTNRSKFNY